MRRAQKNTRRAVRFAWVLALTLLTGQGAEAAARMLLLLKAPSPATSTFTLEGITITGSGPIVNCGDGIGVGTSGSCLVDTGEWIEFRFNNGPTTGVSYSAFIGGGSPQFIDAWGAGDAFLGSVFTQFSAPNYNDIFARGGINAAFGGQAITRFRITPVNGGATNVVYIGFDGQLNLNSRLSLQSLRTSFDPTPCAAATVGTFVIDTVFVNASPTTVFDLWFVVNTLTRGNVVCNADGGPGGTGALVTVPPYSGPPPFKPFLQYLNGELGTGITFAMQFRVGLREFAPFTFFVDAMGGASLP